MRKPRRRPFHIATPTSSADSTVTLCGKSLERTRWICFEGRDNFNDAECSACWAIGVDMLKRKAAQ